MKTTEELLKLEVAALHKELADSKAQLFEVKFGVKNGQNKSTDKIVKLKKYIARIKTLLKQKELTK